MDLLDKSHPVTVLVMLMQFLPHWTRSPDPEERLSCVARVQQLGTGPVTLLFSRLAPSRTLMRFSLTPQRKDKHLISFPEHKGTKMPTCHKVGASSLSLSAERGLEAEGGAICSTLSAPALLSVPVGPPKARQAPVRPNEQAQE